MKTEEKIKDAAEFISQLNNLTEFQKGELHALNWVLKDATQQTTNIKPTQMEETNHTPENEQTQTPQPETQTPAADLQPAKPIEVGDAVNYHINEEEAAELELTPGATLQATVEQIKENGEHILKIQYRTHQHRTKGAYLGNEPGNFWF